MKTTVYELIVETIKDKTFFRHKSIVDNLNEILETLWTYYV